MLMSCNHTKCHVCSYISSILIGTVLLLFYFCVFYMKLKGCRLFHLSSLHGHQFAIINKTELNGV
jgi:hypothetical protein